MNAILCRSCTEHEEKTVLLPVNSTVRGSLRRGRPWLDRLRLTNAGTEKTDKADALGLAHIMRTGWFKKAHIKSEACYRLRLLLTHRRNLKRKFLDLENAIRSWSPSSLIASGSSASRSTQAAGSATNWLSLMASTSAEAEPSDLTYPIFCRLYATVRRR